MALGPPSSAVHIQNGKAVTVSASTAPKTASSVTIHPVALFSILDHYLRRADQQTRVIGTLLGTRSPESSVVEVKASFAVLHSETEEQVAVDMDYHRAMFDLHHRVAPKDMIVGWYSTGGGGGQLNTYDALIQNFYGQETAPSQAVHITVSAGVEGEAGVKAYISSPVGVSPKPENCVFVPIPCELKFHEAERSSLDLLTQAASATPSTVQPSTELELLERSLREVMDMLDRVLAYVRDVLAGKQKGDRAVGRYLMDTFGSSTDDLEKSGFNTSMQDTLMFSYIANLVRSSTEVSARLALATAAS